MTRSITYSDVVFKPYFDMRKFENNIYNKDFIREKTIKTRKKQKLIDNVLLAFTSLFVVVFLIIATLLACQCMKNVRLDYKISKLEKTLEEKRSDYKSENENLNKIIKYDDIKMKAYLELNMIIPTDKNIIYFDKSDQGFVRQYENIH